MAYEPTHDVPASGLPAFAEPDATPGAAAQLVPGLDVQLLERQDDWAYIECSNGWKAWVNGTLLVARAAAPPPPHAPAPEPTPPPSPTPEPAPPTPPVAEPAPPAPAPAPSAPSGAWAAPSAAAAAAPTGRGLRLGPGQIVALVGAALVLISGWLNWADVEGGFTASAYKFPAAFLKDNTVDIPDSGMNLGVLILLIVAVCVVGALVAQVRWLTVVGGVLALLVGAVFLYQVRLLADEVDFGVFDLAGYAPILTIFGGIVATVGGAFALAQRS